MHKFLNLSLSLVLLLSFFSCKKSELDTKIIKDGTDCRISNQEWSSYVSMIKADPNSKQFRGVVTEGKLDETKLHQHIQQTVKCKGGNELEIETSNSEVGTVKLFIENSGSIAGYVNQGTDFQSVMVGLNGDLTYNYPDKSEVYLVNQSLEKKGKLSATNLANLLSTPKNILNNQSNISDLNKTMENVLNSTKGEDVSILVSDFIYSVDNNESLAFAGDITKSIFQNASRKISGLSVLFVYLESNFTGNYYDMNNTPTLLNNAKRPYYIMIVGSNQNIEKFSQKINIPALKGYKGSYFLASESLKPYSEHIYSKDSKGILKTDNTNPNLIIVRRTDNNTVQFSLAVNLQRYPDQQLLLNPQNYNLSNGYELVKIEKIPNNNIPQVVDPNVWVNLKDSEATHILLVKNSKYPLAPDLVISLNNNQPQWVAEVTTLNDTNIKTQLNKTFGLKTLVDGVSNAFSQISKGKPYMELNYKIKE